MTPSMSTRCSPAELRVRTREGGGYSGGRRPAQARLKHDDLSSSKPAQATTYDDGYFYPGPAVKDVPLSMAPASSQAVIKEYGRPEYEKAITDNPQELPLLPDKLVYAFHRWDEEIGSKKAKK